MSSAEPLSILDLILNASILVQLVMGLLFVASVMSWFMIVKSGIYQAHARRALTRFEQDFWSGTDLTQLYRNGNGKANNGGVGGAESIFRAGFKEYTRLRQQPGADKESVMEGIQRVMRVALAREEEKLDQNLPFLASVASVSPYVGLFGTVWGIMSSFRNLANAHQATLAAVAPGISEALIATAMGLFAAIPAVLAYNRFAATSEQLSSNYQIFSEELSALLHRQVHAG